MRDSVFLGQIRRAWGFEAKGSMGKMGKARSLPDRGGDKLAFTSAPLRRKSYPADAGIFSEKAWREIACSLKLSQREFQIVHGVFNDQTEFAIAVNLSISPYTVHTHCARLYRKLAVTDRVKLVLRVTNEFLALTAARGGVPPSIRTTRTVGHRPLRCG